jgi:photosystem II stability/assembly factor-like uncharacterized protein
MNWKDSGPPRTSVIDFVISLENPNTLFVAANGGVFKSIDGGESWRAVNSGLASLSVQTLVMVPQNHDILYAGTRAGVFKTTDGGETWTLVMEGTTRFALAVDPQNADTIYVAPFNEAISKSTDGGKTWITLSQRLPTPVFTLMVDPQDSRTIYACCAVFGLEAGLWKSSDGGESWTDTGLKALRSFAMAPQNFSTLYAGTDGGVFKSIDRGKSWSAVSSGMFATQSRVLGVDPQDPNTVYAAIGSRRQVFKSTNGGLSWRALTGLRPDNHYVWAIHPRNPRIIYAGSWDGLSLSLDGGETWGGLGPAAAFGALAFDPQNPDIFYAGSWSPDSRVYKTSDGGYTWTTPTVTFDYYETRTGIKICSPGVSSLAVDSQNHKVYASLSDCSDQGVDIWRSTDGGSNWESTNMYGFGPVVADPQKTDTVYAGTGYGMAKSTDGGQTWKVIESGLPALSLTREVAIDPQTPSTLYAAVDLPFDPLRRSAVFKSIDAGSSWNPFDAGLTNPSFVTLAVGSRGPNTLYASSARGGLFKIIDDTPLLSLDAAPYCTGRPWRLTVANGVTNTPIRLLGTSNGQSWEVRDWRKTDADGAWNEPGVFAPGTEGAHSLRVDVAGVLSNVVSFTVSECR